MDDRNNFEIKNWRRDTRDRDQWRGLISGTVIAGPLLKNIKEIIHGYTIGADKRRAEKANKARGTGPRKVTEI